VAHAEIRESIPALDGAALAAARLWSFEPAGLGGQPVPSVVFAPVTFELRHP
jgi:outer membrane biosynthesis protein TonB